ncbi:hypothetical protein DFS34DRAFT_565448, partial [Phlyctochytrium arcticum]
HPMRATAAGREVLVVPIVLYANDTSGNRGKKWNKHESFLATLAGLLREQQQRDCNIMFICTSNTCSALQMVRAVIDNINNGLAKGISAIHGITKEEVLLIGGVICFVGDNPMQSDLGCHIGIQKAVKPCRHCDV